MNANEDVRSAAERSLRPRLERVLALLPQAALHADQDVEHVHQLRVATRRAVAACELFAGYLPRRRSRRLVRMLRRIRHAASQARDCDVMLARWHDEPAAPPGALRRVRRLREKAQQPLRELHDRLVRTGRLARRVARLLDRLARAPGGQPFAGWARRVVEQSARDFFDGTRQLDHDEAALHRLRILGKRLRYTLELVADVLPPPFLEDVYPQVEQAQEKLGEFTDHVAARERARAELSRHGADGKARALTRLLAVEEAHAGEAADAFYAWWTPARAGHLRACFRELTPA